MIGSPLINVGIVFAIVAIDNWFLISPIYPLLFGVALPILLLVVFWSFVIAMRQGSKWVVLPIFATLAILGTREQRTR